jgi:hypothetical protein
MADAILRPALVNNINTTFGPANVVATAALVQSLSSGLDFLDISRAAGVIGHMNATEFDNYRKRMDTVIPMPIQRILTAVHVAALYTNPPLPINITINPVSPASISVTYTHADSNPSISIVLHRPDPATDPGLPYPP